MAVGVPKRGRRGKKRPPVSRGRPARLHKGSFHKGNASVEGELRMVSAGKDVSSTHHGSLADIIREVGSRKNRRDQPF